MPDYRLGWTPPPRPDWVQKINDEGNCMNISGVVPLDEDSLISAAKRATGLEDFGSDEWREPFRVLIKSFEEDAALNLIGRIRTRSEILQLLEARLQIEDTYKRHPEIDDEIIKEPLFIVGQGRSGSSFLQNLLAEDPDNGSLMQWEIIYPCPPPEAATHKTDPRIARAHLAIDQWNRVAPTLPSMHEFAGHMPMEDCQALGLDFMSPSWFGSLGQASSYDAYAMAHSYESALRYHKRLLKLLQWKNPRERWLLKDNTHIDRVETLFKVYPDARLIWPHRDPVRAMASVVSLLGTIQWSRSDFPFKGGSFEYVLDPKYAAARLEAFIDKIESGIVPKGRLYNLQYADLVRDPIGTVAGLYQYFGIEFTPTARDALQSYLDNNPRESRPAHKLHTVPDEETKGRRAAFRRYQEYFGVASE